jgi:L-ascorbate metabolism protein UlaG (beta-lactamase superfamily)
MTPGGGGTMPKLGKHRFFMIFAAALGLAACTHSPFRPTLKQYGKIIQEPSGSAEERKELKVTFWGVSSLAFSDDKGTILLDGFASRPPLTKLLFSRLKPHETRIKEALASLPPSSPVLAIFVAHSHYDHAMDAPTISKSASARIFGSSSTRAIAAAEGISEAQISELEDGSTHIIGNFTIRSFVTQHARKERFSGTIGQHTPPARIGDYKTGLNYSFFIQKGECSILVVPSAGRVGEAFRGLKADVVFLGIGELGKKDKVWVDQYWNETIGEVLPKVIVPIHWDDFSQEIRADPLPMFGFVDPIEKTMRVLDEKAKKSAIKLLLPIAMRAVNLDNLGECDSKEPR